MHYYFFLIFFGLTLALKATLPPEVEIFISNGKFQDALNILEPLAQNQSGEAQNKIGEIYHFGSSNIRNYSFAKEWYIKAVQNGNGVAANHLGRMYSNGEGVTKDLAKQRFWYRKGMLLGDLAAERNYYFIEKNPFYFILDRALDNDPEAMFVAANCYQYGKLGIPQDISKAVYFLQKSAKLDYIESKLKLEKMHSQRIAKER